MRLLACVMLLCVTLLAMVTERTWADYLLQKQKLEIEQQQLQLDILKYINAQNEKIEREMNKVPVPQRPSMEVRPSFAPKI